jgi:hypothetical protein
MIQSHVYSVQDKVYLTRYRELRPRDRRKQQKHKQQ